MRLSAVALLMILTTVFLSGCASDKLATVEDHGRQFYAQSGVMTLAQAAPVTEVSVANLSTAPQNVVAETPAPSGARPQGARWQWPVQGQVIEKFGQQSQGVVNEGIVIAAAEGTPIKAAQSGEVAFVGKDTKNYGNIVIVRHANGDMSSYAHARNIVVTKGEHVDEGATIAFVGKSGNAKAPQLHFAIRSGHTSIDPLTRLPNAVAMNP